MDLLRWCSTRGASRRRPATNALTIKDTPERIAAAARVHLGDRQGAARGDHRRRAARGRSHASCRSTACRSRRPDRPASTARSTIDRRDRRRSRCETLRNLTQSDILLANLPALYYRLLKTDTNTRTLANPQLRTSEGIAGAGAIRRTGAGAGDDVRADRHRRHAAAADHVVQLREHRREHRHHAAHASRRRRVAGAEDRGARASRAPASAGCRRSATARSTPSIRLRDGETNMLAGLIRDDERHVARRHSRAERHAGRRPAVRAHARRRRSRPTSS